MKHLNRKGEIKLCLIDSRAGIPMQGPLRRCLKIGQAGNKTEKVGGERGGGSNFHHWKPFMQASILQQLFKNCNLSSVWLEIWSALTPDFLCHLFTVSNCRRFQALRHANRLPEVQLEFNMGCTLSCKHAYFVNINPNSQKDERSNESVSNYRVTFLGCNNWEIAFSIKSWSFIRSHECRWEFVKPRLNFYKAGSHVFPCHAWRIWHFVWVRWLSLLYSLSIGNTLIMLSTL